MSRKTLLLLLIILIQFFQNCDSQHKIEWNDSDQSSLAEDPVTEAQDPVCEDILFKQFESTYHGFFKEQSCDRCHSPEKIASIPAIAQADKELAFQSFLAIGPSRIEGKLRGGHQGYVFADYEQDITDFKEMWLAAKLEKDKCEFEGTGNEGEPAEPEGLLSSEKVPGLFQAVNDPLKCGLNYDVLPEKRGWTTLSWPLESDKASLKGVVFSIDLFIDTIEFGSQANPFYCPKGYRLRNPRLSTGDQAVQVKRISILLNDDDQGVSTFLGIDTVVDEKSSEFELDPHGASAPFEVESYSADDQWRVEFELIRISQ